MSGIVSVYAVFGSADEARRLARLLVEERLAACANILAPCHSIYRWQGRVQTDAEVLLLMKTRRALVPRLKERLPQLHPYDVPELVVADVTDGLEPYCRWVLGETEG